MDYWVKWMCIYTFGSPHIWYVNLHSLQQYNQNIRHFITWSGHYIIKLLVFANMIGSKKLSQCSFFSFLVHVLFTGVLFNFQIWGTFLGMSVTDFQFNVWSESILYVMSV